MKTVLKITIFNLLALAQFNAFAEVNLRIALQPGSIIREGASAKISVSAAGKVSPEDPTINVEGGNLDIRRIGKGLEYMRNNQGVTRVTTYTFEVRGKIGKYNIKGIVKGTDGSLYETDTLRLQVRERTAKEKALEPKLLLKVANGSPFVGEPAFAELTLMLQPNTRLYQERTNIAKVSGNGIRAVFLDGPKEAPPVNGKRAIRFLYQISPLKAGKLSLTASFNPLLQLPSVSGQRTVDERFELNSKAVSIKSRPLPTEGQPADFSGAIGNFSLKLQADPLSVQTGEPIAMRFAINGTGSFEFIQAPKPTTSEGWKFYDPTKLDLQRGEPGKPSQLIFAQNIVPQTKHTALPTFRLTVFDSKKEQYVTLITDKVPVTVNAKNTQIAGTNPSFASPPIAQNSTAPSPQATLSDILIPATTITPTWSIARSPAWRNPTFWTLNALSILILFTSAGFFRISKKRSQRCNLLSYSDLLNELKNITDYGNQFHITAYECLERHMAEQSAQVEPGPILIKIQERYEYIKFGGKNQPPLTQLDEPERSAIIEELTNLKTK